MKSYDPKPNPSQGCRSTLSGIFAAVSLWQQICLAAMMIDQRLTNASFWANIKFHRFCLFGDRTITCFRQ